MRNTQAPQIVGVVAAFSLALAAPGGGNEKNLAERVTVLETTVASLTQQLAALTQPTIVNVDCAAGGTIQAALASVQNHPAPVAIRVSGVCSENLVLPRSRIAISGVTAGAGITAAHPAAPVVRVTSSPGNGTPLLNNLTIGGGTDGVSVDVGAEVRLFNCVVRNNITGVRADNRVLVRLEHTVVEHNTFAGVSAANASHVFISGGVIQNNGGDGLALGPGATAVVGDSATIASSGRYGISAADGSVLSLNTATITGSALTGIFVNGGSTVVLGKGATITANLGSGISLMDTSLVHKHRAEADIHITNNQAFGVVCSVLPAVAQIVGFTSEPGNITGNGIGNINCTLSPGPLAQ